MKRFGQFEYVRPDGETLGRKMAEMTARLGSGGTSGLQAEAIEEINRIRDAWESMTVLGRIRHTLDTTDPFYDRENDALDQLGPLYDGLRTDYYRALVSSRFRGELEGMLGRHLFRLAELKLSTFSPEVIQDLRDENALASSYVKLKASASIDFQGETRNLSQMQPFTQSPRREVRREAVAAVSAFYRANMESFDTIYDRLVKTRHAIARKLGFENFIPLAYARLGRTDYDQAMVAGYRDQIIRHVVPLASGLRARQARRLGVDSLEFCDEGLEFLTGNPTPRGDPAWIVATAGAMYAEMSPETGEFFRFMLDRELMDLETRKGKAGGGYCDYISGHGSPFIFANFNGTSGDVDVLTHEAGHAFQAYRSRGFSVPEYHFPTLEACEIHSMSMEFFAWPWMERFFGDDLNKYLFSHLAGTLLFIPYGAAVDEFQHMVYGNPGASPGERRSMWRSVERKYLPHRKYPDDDFLEGGGFWFRQGHIFQDPFYYIDYTLAQVCALEFWKRSRGDRGRAWADYIGLCDLGGSLPFTGLVKAAGLRNPFEEGAIRAVADPAAAWLDSVDDGKL